MHDHLITRTKLKGDSILAQTSTTSSICRNTEFQMLSSSLTRPCASPSKQGRPISTISRQSMSVALTDSIVVLWQTNLSQVKALRTVRKQLTHPRVQSITLSTWEITILQASKCKNVTSLIPCIRN